MNPPVLFERARCHPGTIRGPDFLPLSVKTSSEVWNEQSVPETAMNSADEKKDDQVNEPRSDGEPATINLATLQEGKEGAK